MDLITFDNAKTYALIGGVLIAGFIGWRVYQRGREVITKDLNPVSDENIVYKGVIGGLGRTISGDEHWTLGGWFYDWTHGGPYDPNK